jgi:hypothetical protein
MPAKKTNKTTKRLRQGKKLEATKPLNKLQNACATGTHIPEGTIVVR